MATAIPAVETQSIKFYDAFIAWAEKNGEMPSPQLFEEWDAKHNHYQMKLVVFGGDAEIYRVGLTALYTRYFYNCSAMRFKRPDGSGSITVQPYRKAGKGVGSFADITSPETTKAERKFMLAKLEGLVDQLLQMIELLGMTRKELMTYIETK